MNIFWVFNGQRLKKYLIFTVAALFTAGILFVEQDAWSIFSSNEDVLVAQPEDDQPRAISSVDTKEKKIALTFDISWGQKRPGPILDALEEKGVDQATFFLSSPWAEHHTDIVDRIQEMGFEIGSHGHKHENYSHLEDNEIREQIMKAHRIIGSITGQPPTLLRPPNGDFDQRVLNIADELDYTVIQWGTNSKDWTNPGVDRIVENVLSNTGPGDIILMHASDSSKQTHEALPIIIDQLKKQGYEFVTVTDLISEIEGDIKEMGD